MLESTISYTANGRLGITSATEAEKVQHTVREKSVGNDEINITDKLEQIVAYKDGDHQNKYKDETCTYCNKKGHKETVFL